MWTPHWLSSSQRCRSVQVSYNGHGKEAKVMVKNRRRRKTLKTVRGSGDNSGGVHGWPLVLVPETCP